MNNSSPKNHQSSSKPRTKIQRSSNKKSMPPKPSKKQSLKNQQPFVNPFQDVKQHTVKQQKAAEKLVQLLENKLYQHKKQIIDLFNLNSEREQKRGLQKISNVTDDKIKEQLHQSLNAIKKSQRRSSIQQQKDQELQEALSKQQIQQLEERFRQLDPDASSKKSKNPYQSVDYIKSKQDIQLNSARSMNSKKLPFKKDQKQPSIDLTKNDGQDLKKISLSSQTKQALVKLQKYDKQFSRIINEKTFKNVLDTEYKRQQKIKTIHRGMRAITYDNELTVGCLVNIMKYHGDISKQIKQRQLLLEKNQQLQLKLTNVTKTKDDEIKQLKSSLKSKFGDEGGRNKLLDTEIKDFKKGNELLITALNEGNVDKAKKLIQPQIKKLNNSSNNKQIAFERKELLQVIFGLLNNQGGAKSESSIQSSSIIINLNNMLNADISPIFAKQSSIQRNISQLQKCRRQIEPKIQDTKLYQTKQLYQTLSQGCNYIISLYQELRQKTNNITSLNRKIADMERVVERTDRQRVQSVQKGDKIIEGLKDGLERERRNSREMMKKINSSSKQLNQQKQKNDIGRSSLVNEQWQQVVKNIIHKLESNDLTWFSEIPNIKKRFLNKKQIDNDLKAIISNDITLFEIMMKQNKYLQKIEKQNQGLQKRLSSDQKLQFKPNQIQKKYDVEKQKAQQLLSEKNSLVKQLKQLQRQNEKPKDPQFDQIIHMNKLCFSVDSTLKTPFNRQIWSKLQTKLQSKSEYKNLNSISNTIQTLYNRLFDHLLSIDISSRLNKQSRLKPAVKQLVKQSHSCENNMNQKILDQILQLIRSIIQNEFEIQKYIQLVNSLPILIDSLTQKILQNQQNVKTIEQLENQIQQMNIRMIQIQFQLSKRIQLQKQSNNSQLNKETILIQVQQLKNKYRYQQEQYQLKIEQLEQKVNKYKQSTFYRNKTLSQLHQQVDELKEIQIKSTKKIEQLQEQLFEKSSLQQLEQGQQTSNIKRNEQPKQTQTDSGQKNNSNTIYIQTETELPQSSEKQISLQNNESSHEQNQNVNNPLQQLEQIRRLKDDVSLKEEHICRLKKWVLDKQAIITNLQNSQANLKTQLAIFKQSFSQSSENSSPSAISPQSNYRYVHNIQQQKDNSTRKIQQLQFTLNTKQQQIQKYKQLSQKHRLLFEGCCKQMQELHLNSQEEMQSLSQMHLKNQSLLQDQIDLLKTEKSKLINKLKEVELQANQLNKQVKKDQKERLLEYKTLENQYNELANINQIAAKEVQNLEQQNTMLKERIITIEKQRKQDQQISEDMRKSFSSVLDKRRKRLQSRASNKNNIAPSDSGFQLSAKLTTLLENEGKLPSSALKVIIQAINKLIASNKKLIERVKRTERQNNALYEAINHITQNQQDLGQGISIIMHLQQVLTGLVQWLDVQQIANQNQLKLAHFFQRLQGCLSKTNYFRYVEIFQQFLQHTIVMVFQKSQQQLHVQNSQIDSLKQKLMVALDEHLHDIVDEGETDGDEQGKILNQVRILLGVYLKTKNLKVIEDLVAILNIDEVSFG